MKKMITDFIQIKITALQTTLSIKMKRQARDGEQIFTKHIVYAVWYLKYIKNA